MFNIIVICTLPIIFTVLILRIANLITISFNRSHNTNMSGISEIIWHELNGGK